MTDQNSNTLFPLAAATSPPGRRPRAVLTAKQSKGFKKPIEVTQADIDTAMRQNSHSCMIADAIKRQVKGATKVQVDLGTVRFTDVPNNRRVVCLTPIKAQDALCRFDLGVKPKPFSFHLRSTQVTALSRSKTVHDGDVVRRQREYVRKDGSVAVHKSGVVAPRQAPPKPQIVKQGGGTELIVGGVSPPVHRASVNRRFGAMSFTWLDDEDPREVIKRQGLGRFEAPEPASGNDIPAD